MRYRALCADDIPYVQGLYYQMLLEGNRLPLLRYPRWDRATPLEYGEYLLRQLLQPTAEMIAYVAIMGGHVDGQRVRGGKPKGFIVGTCYPRQIGHPKWVGHCEALYVDPTFRGGRGRAAVGKRLIQLIAEEAERRHPGIALEGSYVPGTHGERLWKGLGLRPYVTFAAFVDPKGHALPARALFASRARRRTEAPEKERAHG